MNWNKQKIFKKAFPSKYIYLYIQADVTKYVTVQYRQLQELHHHTTLKLFRLAIQSKLKQRECPLDIQICIQ